MEPNGNALSDPAQEFSGRNILYRRTADRELSRRLGRTEEEIRDILQKGRQTLLQQRQRRTRPHLDDKVITAWNGLMLSALAKGSRILEDRRYLQAAEETADFLLAQLVVDGDLKRRWRMARLVSTVVSRIMPFSSRVFSISMRPITGRRACSRPWP